MNKLYDNEKVFSDINDQLAASSVKLAAGDFPADYTLGLYCECANKACEERVSIALDKYREAKGPLIFVVRPEHYFPQFEELLSKTDDYWLIKKKLNKLAKPFEM